MNDWNRTWIDNQGSIPWENNRPDQTLTEYVVKNKEHISSVLELGCGSGINANWMWGQGLAVKAIDISSIAISLAKERNSNIDFVESDVFSFNDITTYDLIFDRGCYHNYSDLEEQELFIKKVSTLLSPAGQWLSIIGSSENKSVDFGPPKHIILDIITVFDKHLKIIEIKECIMELNFGKTALGWKVVSCIR
jgi:SAM-dependent methyltransferase